MGKKHVIAKTEEELIKEGAEMEATLKKETKVSPSVHKVTEGKVYINSSFNNTLMTLTDSKGNSLGWASAGGIGFKGSKKATPFAASKVAETIAQTAQKIGIGKVEVYVKGVGSGRESAIRSLAARGLELALIKDETPIPHNGCRPVKSRRV